MSEDALEIYIDSDQLDQMKEGWTIGVEVEELGYPRRKYILGIRLLNEEELANRRLSG